MPPWQWASLRILFIFCVWILNYHQKISCKEQRPFPNIYHILRNGNWKSHWIYRPGEGGGTLKGQIASHSHSFEEGNVQSVTCKSFSTKFDEMTEDKLIKEILKFMYEADLYFLKSLQTYHVALSDSIFKVTHPSSAWRLKRLTRCLSSFYSLFKFIFVRFFFLEFEKNSSIDKM